MNKTIRKSNLELLRIISMILIIMHHYALHGEFRFPELSMSGNQIIVQTLSIGGKLGVNCFLLITGYFMVDAQFKIKKLIKLILQVWFYSVGITAFLYLLGLREFMTIELWESLFPLTYSVYWFATAYIVLYMLVPFLNIFIKSLSARNYRRLLLLLFVIWSAVPTVLHGDLCNNELGFFIFLYLIAAYIKRYPNRYFARCRKNMIWALSLYGLIFASIIVMDLIGTKTTIFYTHETYFIGENKIPLLLCSITLFLGFKNLNIGYHVWINRIASSMLGVYLIHDNLFLRTILWGKWFHPVDHINSPYLWLNALKTITLIFVCSLVIDQLRIALIERPLFRLFDKKEDAVKVRFQHALQKYKKEEDG